MDENHLKLADLVVGQRLRVRRKELGLAQAKLGAALGVSFQQIQKYEKGHNRISASRLARISSYLKVSPAYFLQGLDLDEADIRQIVAVLDTAEEPDTMRLNIAFLAIRSPAMRATVLRFIVEIADGVDLEKGDRTIAALPQQTPASHSLSEPSMFRTALQST